MVDGKFEPSPVQPVDEITSLKEKREEYEEKKLDRETESVGVGATPGDTTPYQKRIDKINKEIENREYDMTVADAAPSRDAMFPPPTGADPGSPLDLAIKTARGTGPEAWKAREFLDSEGREWRP